MPLIYVTQDLGNQLLASGFERAGVLRTNAVRHSANIGTSHKPTTRLTSVNPSNPTHPHFRPIFNTTTLH